MVLPLFSWLNCSPVYINYDMCIKVDFPGDWKDDVMLLNSVENEATVFEGYFKNERDVLVSVVTTGTNITVSKLFEIGDCTYKVD